MPLKLAACAAGATEREAEDDDAEDFFIFFPETQNKIIEKKCVNQGTLAKRKNGIENFIKF